MKTIEYKPAQSHNQYQQRVTNRFLGGLQLTKPAISLEDDEFQILRNVYIDDDGLLQSRAGYEPVHTGSESLEDITAFHDTDIFTNRYLRVVDTLTNYKVQYSSGTGWTDIVSLSHAEDVRFLDYNANAGSDVLFFNGQDSPYRWNIGDGHSALGLAPPNNADAGTPDFTIGAAVNVTAETPAEPGIDFKGDIYYRFTYHYNDGTKFGESNGTSKATGEVYNVTGVDGTTTKQEVPITFNGSWGTGVEYVKIYRSTKDTAHDDRQGQYYFIGTIYNPDTTFKDRIPSGGEGSPMPLDDGYIPKIKYAVNTRGRLVASDGDYPKKLVWTEPGEIDKFPALNFFYFDTEIKGLVNYKRELYIFTEAAVYVLPSSDFSQDPVKISDKGCIAGDTCVDVNLGICWLAKEGIYFANMNTQAEDGDLALPMGQPLKVRTDTISSTYAEKASACFYENKYVITIPADDKPYAWETYMWSVEAGTTLLRGGRWGGWTRTDFAAQWVASGKYLFHTTPTSIPSGANRVWVPYSHSAQPATGKVYDYPTESDTDKKQLAIIIKTGMYTPPIDVNETVLVRTSITARTTGSILDVKAIANSQFQTEGVETPGIYPEYTKQITFDLGSGAAADVADASGWMVWDIDDWPHEVVVTSGAESGTDSVYSTTDTNGIGASEVLEMEAYNFTENATYNGTGEIQALSLNSSVTLNINSTGTDSTGGDLAETTPTWALASQPTQRVVTHRWPKGTKANALELEITSDSIGQTVLYNLTHYIKEFKRSI
jgi:hypothetical protein